MDPLTDIFTAMRVESVVYGRLEATAPWGLHFEDTGHAKFGMVLGGECWLSTEGSTAPALLTAGDCYLLPRGNTYALRDNPQTMAEGFAAVLANRQCGIIRYGGGGSPTTVIGGKFLFDGHASRPLTEILPALIHIKSTETETQALQCTLRLLASELASPGPGSQVVVSRLADTLFVQAIRAFILTSEGMATGWLRALADPSIGAALRSMHERIEFPWTVAALASEAGMSRSAFALRFREFAGESPLEYLTSWRMQRAGRLLRDRQRKMLEVANLVGYTSDVAFNKSFKRFFGVTPGEFRRNGHRESAETQTVTAATA